MEKQIKVLVVDDEDDFRQLMRFWLISEGYSAIEAPNGKVALKVIKKEKPDMVFLDLNMPVMDGPQTLKKLRKFNKNIPVIVISAFLEDPRITDAAACGISGVFHKSDKFEEGLKLLEVALRRHKRL